eukprot:352103-Chlamydomonas_euryale.AAC.5
MHGRTNAWTNERTDAWMHGCMDAWMHGCMDQEHAGHQVHLMRVSGACRSHDRRAWTELWLRMHAGLILALSGCVERTHGVDA